MTIKNQNKDCSNMCKGSKWLQAIDRSIGSVPWVVCIIPRYCNSIWAFIYVSIYYIPNLIIQTYVYLETATEFIATEEKHPRTDAAKSYIFNQDRILQIMCALLSTFCKVHITLACNHVTFQHTFKSSSRYFKTSWTFCARSGSSLNFNNPLSSPSHLRNPSAP